MYIKVHNEWNVVEFFYTKENQQWVQVSENAFLSLLENNVSMYEVSDSLRIICDDQYVGKFFYCTAKYNGESVYPTWSLISGSQYATINSNGKVVVSEGIVNQPITISCQYSGMTVTKEVTVSYNNQLTIEGADTMTGTNGNVAAKFNSLIVTPTWSIISGGTNATIANDGTITILSSGTITVQAVYQGYTTTKEIALVYESGIYSETTVNDDGSVTTTTTIVTENQDGSTTETSTSETRHDDGSISTTESETTTNQDGSSTSTSTTVNQDGTSSQTTANTSSDGSSTSTTTNYNAEGDPESGSNNETDTNGNSSTQEVIYDESGGTTVTAYTIDTSSNPDGEKDFNADGVNTEYYAFDLTHGFEILFDFKFDKSQQPTGQNENHHNILTMKRATPEPWYGFQLRQTGTNSFLVLGTQFSGGGNTNTQIAIPSDKEISLRITYKPWLNSGSFVCYNLRTETNVFVSNGKFPDEEDLRYLAVTIGYAMDANGDPFRYSNVDVLNFSIRRLNNIENPVITCDGQTVSMSCATQDSVIYYRLGASGSFVQYTSPIRINSDTVVYAYAEVDGERSETVTENCIYDSGIEDPVITCDGSEVTITCATQDATINYRLNQQGSYSAYTAPIAITADTIVEAYGELNGITGNVVSANCLYDNGIATPVITCDGEYVSIACATTDADLYYRLNETGSYSAYTHSFEITADTIVEAYAQVGSETGHIATQTCVYSPVVLVEPTIIFNGEVISIVCSTQDATINYRLDQEGNYSAYTSPITITADTFVETYSTYRGRVSSVVTRNCIYNPIHDYSQDYLTFRITSAGTICWKSVGSFSSTIEYSLNNGAWTSIVATASPTGIPVVEGDVIRFRGNNQTYAQTKAVYASFGKDTSGSTDISSTAHFIVEGNIMSLVYGDNFVGNTAMTGTYNFCSIFKRTNVDSAENLVLPATTLTNYCYRAMFSWCTSLSIAPQLPATTLAQGCYWYMFEKCAITDAPELNATSLVKECYGYMFTNCANLNYIKCMATTNLGVASGLTGWVKGVAASGTFVKDGGTTWATGDNGIPRGWVVFDDVAVSSPVITYDGFNTVTITCATQGADIYYNVNRLRSYTLYTAPFTISDDAYVEAYSVYGGQTSVTINQNCVYVSDVPFESSNRDLEYWSRGGQTVTTPYSVNQIDGHSSNYAKGTFNFETSFALRQAQPTYLWFQHADQSADIYVDDVKVETHWGGYTAFFSDISNYVHSGTNIVKVALCNTTRNTLAPAAGDFNFNATLGNVKLFTSPYIPSMSYGYDGCHITSTVSSASATINVRTNIPTGATVVCTISGTNCNYTATSASTGNEMLFTTTISNPHLWNGTLDPYLYNVKLEIYHDNELYHRYERPYGLRFYEYVINDITKVGTAENPYTGFLLNGSPYLLRGCCMHDDIEGRANALTDADYDQTFSVIQELGCNFLRLAHYPHPKEVYDRCDQLGIVVQTEAPCVNKLQSTMPTDYYTHLETQYSDMVNQHYNHPCIFFWGLSNETTTDDKAFGKTKVEGYTALIKNLDSERMVGYVLAQSPGTSPSAYYNDPSNVDWFGCNIYVGWYDSPNSNTPTGQIATRLNNTINRVGKPMAYSEYGCGGTQRCHSDDFMNTTTRGNHERHDIEYMMWLHEGHIATIKQYPQIMFTAQWQLFDIAVSNRNEGYTVCLDGENASIDDNLRRLNDKGLVERDHTTKKDPFYLYKAWWNPTPFVHICGKDYTKTTDRKIKCYTNGTGTFTLYVNNTSVATATPTDNILEFAAQNFSAGDIIRVDGTGISDTFTFAT